MTQQQLTPFEAWELFVGLVTVEEFLQPFSTADEAIDQLMTERWWEADPTGTPAPSNLPDLIREYIERQI